MPQVIRRYGTQFVIRVKILIGKSQTIQHKLRTKGTWNPFNVMCLFLSQLRWFPCWRRKTKGQYKKFHAFPSTIFYSVRVFLGGPAGTGPKMCCEQFIKEILSKLAKEALQKDCPKKRCSPRTSLRISWWVVSPFTPLFASGFIDPFNVCKFWAC